MIDRRTFVAALGAACTMPAIASAELGILSPREAHDAVKAGTLLLVDIRTPEEWQQTGVAEGAWPLDMRRRDFGPLIMAMVERNPNHKIAVICRTGRRSGFLVQALAQHGIKGILDVTEGMAGGRAGPGWIKTGLPLVSAKVAVNAIPSDLTAA